MSSTPAKRKVPSTFTDGSSSSTSASGGIKRSKPLLGAFSKARNASVSTISGANSARASPAPVGARVGASSVFGANRDEEVVLFHQGIKDDTGKINEYTSENDRCPVCKTDRYSKPTLRILISPCYHKMCETCIDQLYTLGPQGCPQCGRILRKTNYIHQTFEDLNVEKEVSIRKRLAAIFNRTRQDFDSDRAYNDYLEMTEDITFNLIEGIDVPATEARVTKWQKENQSTIQANADRQKEEHERQKESEAEEKRAREEKVNAAKLEDAELLRQIEEAKREAFDDIADGGDGKEAYARLDRLKAELQEVKHDENAGIPRKSARRYPASSASAAVPSGAAGNPLSVYYSGPFVPLPYNDPRKSKGFSLLYLAMDKVVEITGGEDLGPYHDPEYELKIEQTHTLRRAPEEKDVALRRMAAGGFLMDDLVRRELFEAQDGLFLGV